MRKLKTRNVFKASNLTIDLDNMTAISYDWWYFLIQDSDGAIYFNDYNYSPTTSVHQRKAWDVLRDNLPSDVFNSIRTIKSSVSLDRGIKYSIKDNINTLLNENQELQQQITKPRTHKSKNLQRSNQIGRNLVTIARLESYYGSDFDRYAAFNREVAGLFNEGLKSSPDVDDSNIIKLDDYR